MERSKSLAAGLIVTFGFFLSACNFYHEKNPGPALDLSQRNLSYAALRAEIFSPQCVACHNSASAKGGVVLDSYDSVIANLDGVERSAVIDQTMPRAHPLAPDDRSLLRAWILAGAPREGGASTPPPKPKPLKPTFRSIRTGLFEAKCISCHTTGETAEKVPLTDYSLLMNSPRDLVLPGNADESGLIIALERTDDHQMPPTESGLGRVSDQDIATIRKWIIKGAKND